jgi:hypothetical protein
MGDVLSATAAATGAVVDMSTPSVDAAFPGYCSWMPFADYMTACQVPTAAVQNAAVKQEIDKAAAGNTALADQQYQQYLADTAALAKLNPEGAAQYKFAGDNPNTAALLGADPFGRVVGSAAQGVLSVTGWLGIPAWIWIAGGGVGFLALSRRRGR